jgi:uncharacterized membrane protein (DUF4010 family)
MATEELLSRFAVALGIGLLIGLERGWRTREERSGSRAAGLRTFGISGLLGGIVGALAQMAGGVAGPSSGGAVVLGFGLAAFAVVITLFCLEENRADQTYSATTAVAAMLTFALGAYALLGDMRVAAAVAVVTAGLLAFRESLHRWIKSVTWPELRSGLILLAMTFIALPVLPDGPFGPFGGINPREIWLIAIVLAGVSFLGYVAVKYFGEQRGILVSGIAGGLMSSTAVTFANARRAAADEGAPQLLAAGVALATAVSLLRVLGIVGVLRPSLLAMLAPSLAAATLVTIGFGLFWAYRCRDQDGGHSTAKFRNPFSVWSVIALALAMGAVVLGGRALSDHLGPAGAIVGAAVVGLFDVDTVTVSMAGLASEPQAQRDAAYAVLAAVASNAASKLVIVIGLGRGRFAWSVAVMSAAAMAAGLMALWPVLRFAPVG